MIFYRLVIRVHLTVQAVYYRLRLTAVVGAFDVSYRLENTDNEQCRGIGV